MERRFLPSGEEIKRCGPILDMIQVIFLSLDPEGRVIFINRKGCEVLGYEREEILGKDWFDNFLPFRIRDEVRGVFNRIIEGKLELVEFFENPVLTRSGEERIIAWHNSALFDESGRIVEVISAGEDVTDLKRHMYVRDALFDLVKDILMEELSVSNRARIVVKACVERLGALLAWVGKAEPDGSVRILAWYPEEHRYVRELMVRWDDTPHGRGPSGKAIRSGTYQVVEDIALNGDFEPWREIALPWGFKTIAVFPMTVLGRVYGVLTLYSDTSGFFNEERKRTFQAVANLAASALENAYLYEESQRRLNMLEALRRIDKAISGSLDPKLTLEVALNEIIHQLGVDAASVLSFNPWSKELEYMAGSGFLNHGVKRVLIRLGEGLAGRSALEKVPFVLRDSEEDEVRGLLLREEGFKVYIVTPLISKGKLLGVLEVFARRPLEVNEDWINFFETLAGQLAIALDNAELLRGLERTNLKLFQAYDSTIEALAKALELRDRETEGHSERVVDLTLRIAKRLGIEGEELVHIRRGALLHDIGKLGIPDSILLKPGKLTEDEWEMMKMHPVYAYQILSKVEYLRPALDIPYYHHERWDGSGYPKGLKGEEIPLPARIFAVVDVYDALTHDRPYRKAWSEREAIDYIVRESGRLFDPKVVQAFLDVLREDQG